MTDTWTTLEVESAQLCATDVMAITLVDPGGEPLPGWAPGAHIDVDLGAGFVRQYSLCGDPGDTGRWRIAVLRERAGRGGSERVHSLVRAGVKLPVRGPRNHFPLVDADRYLFIAGGIGITPILPMVREAARQGLDWRLWYGGRSASAMAFVDELRAIDTARVRLFPADHGSRIDLDDALGRPADDTAVYCCGPESLRQAVQDKCAAWPDGTLHFERFAAPKTAGAVPAGDGDPDSDTVAGTDVFVVVAQASGAEVKVPVDKSILEALEEANIAAPFSCREGICGTCEVRVLEGTPDHRDLVLSDDERKAGNCMMICVSRAKCARLVIDL